MRILNIKDGNITALKKYWENVHIDTPYHFKVDVKTWVHQFFDRDRILFHELDGYIALNSRSDIVGFVMYGLPKLYWDRTGQQVKDPNIGVIRHIFFNKHEPLVGQKLLDVAMNDLCKFDDYYAFYHALGLPFMAGHGKLAFQSSEHIESLLFHNGFTVEHENYYFVYKINNSVPGDQTIKLNVVRSSDKKRDYIQALMEEKEIGTAEVLYLDQFTRDDCRTVYLKWIGILDEYRGKGYGSKFLNEIIHWYAELGYEAIHLDTASNNGIAQKLYLKHGFHHVCNTRSYIKSI